MPKNEKPRFDKAQLEAGVMRMIQLRKATEGLPELSVEEVVKEKKAKKEPKKKGWGNQYYKHSGRKRSY